MENVTIWLVCALNFDKAPRQKHRTIDANLSVYFNGMAVIVISVVAVLHSSHSIASMSFHSQYARSFSFLFIIHLYGSYQLQNANKNKNNKRTKQAAVCWLSAHINVMLRH